jgi:hypothetical protein
MIPTDVWSYIEKGTTPERHESELRNLKDFFPALVPSASGESLPSRHGLIMDVGNPEVIRQLPDGRHPTTIADRAPPNRGPNPPTFQFKPLFGLDHVLIGIIESSGHRGI